MDQLGYLYVSDSDNNRVCKISPQGNVITIAGMGGKGKNFFFKLKIIFLGYADEIGSAAQFKFPIGITLDKQGKIYVADYR
jgi:DNA-binding beta-propeller fold protein YncE